jgi:SRSO17 transposase
VAAGHSIGPSRWQRMFDGLMGRVAGRFARPEPRRRARAFVAGLLAELPRKNCWTIAEHAGHGTPDGLQHLLGRAVWDADAVRDDVRDYVVEHLGDPDAVLVVDETGDVKKGTRTVGVQRQYTGTAGRVENAQVAVYLTYATARGHAIIDRALYLPQSWAGDPTRCAPAGVPADTGFATKPELARTMITRALDGGAPAGWVAGDEVYGADPRLRAELERRGVGYVLEVSCSHRLPTPAGDFRADTLATRVPARVWRTYSAGAGTKGQRYYDWALIEIVPSAHGGCHALLIRRNRNTGELAYFRCYTPHPVPLATLVRVAGRRWTVEQSFQTGKGLAGLDEHQVRRWTSWHRWVTLAMLAQAFLAVTAAIESTRPSPPGQIPLTCNEICHLFSTPTGSPVESHPHRGRWSAWRRRHQHRARTSHYRRQAAREP